MELEGWKVDRRGKFCELRLKRCLFILFVLIASL